MKKAVLEAPVVSDDLTDLRAELVAHPLYHNLCTLGDVRVFMQHHVFAVWDFMCLLKALQRQLTCVELPWAPVGDNGARRFVNEIVLGEESDEDGRGGFRSHFELYLEAMEECGADTRAIQSFLQSVREGDEVETALALCSAPPSVCRFVLHTMEIARCGQTHRIAAAFFFGREDVIPDMFIELVEDLRREFFGLDRLIYYLDRHIEVDGDDHGPRAQAILEKLCSGDPRRKEESLETARASLETRAALWDGVLRDIGRERLETSGIYAT